jgi:hypothetical protein
MNIDKVRIAQIMFPLFDRYNNPDYIDTELKSLHEGHEITDEEYDICMEHWDEILLDWESQ